MAIPFSVDVRTPNPIASYYTTPNSQAIHHVTQPTFQQFPSGPEPRQNIQNRDHLPVWRRLPTMSQEEIDQMMWRTVGLAGNVILFGAIWRAIADYGGYANVSSGRFVRAVCLRIDKSPNRADLLIGLLSKVAEIRNDQRRSSFTLSRNCHSKLLGQRSTASNQLDALSPWTRISHHFLRT
jgi:hypothetical protein